MLTDKRHTHWLAALCLVPTAASAITEITPYGQVEVHHDSNVFGYSGKQEAAVTSGSERMADTVLSGRAGLEVEHRQGQQRLRASAEARRFDYRNFQQLDHDGYRWDAAFDWRLGSRLDGRFDWRQERRLAALADRNDSQLALEQERIGGAAVGLALGPVWRVEGTVHSRRLHSPLSALPDFGLEEESVGLGVNYLGVSKFKIGILGEYLDGEYVGTAADAPFKHTRFELAASYAISGLSELEARLGRTQREDRFADGTDHRLNALTGALGFKRTISGLSAVDAEIFRRINSYVAGPDAVVETGIRVGVQWQPSVKLGYDLGLEFLDSDFEGGFAGPQQREDRYKSAFLRVNYQPLQWLGVHPYAELRDRSSNVQDERYRGNIIGLELRVRFGAAVEVGR